MQIFVRTLANTTVTVEIEGSDPVREVKRKIGAKLGINPAEFDLAFGGKMLQDAQPIEDYNVQKSNTVQLIARLPGGFDL
jgi:ubiquitin C